MFHVVSCSKNGVVMLYWVFFRVMWYYGSLGNGWDLNVNRGPPSYGVSFRAVWCYGSGDTGWSLFINRGPASHLVLGFMGMGV